MFFLVTFFIVGFGILGYWLGWEDRGIQEEENRFFALLDSFLERMR